MQVDDKQRYLMVTEAAYFLAERRNFEPGHEHEDWQAAEQQVDEMLMTMARQPELEQRIEAGERTKPVLNAEMATPAKRTTTTLAKTKQSPRGKQALAQGRQTTESNQASAMQDSLTAEANEQAKPARKARAAKAKAPVTSVKAKTATGGRKAKTAKQSVAAGAIPSERMPQVASGTGEQPEVMTKAPAKRTRRSTKTEQPASVPMAAASQEGSKPGRKPRQKKTEANAAKGDGRRRSKTTAV